MQVEQPLPENSAYDAVYEWQDMQSAYVAYIPGIGEKILPEYIWAIAEGTFNMVKADLDQGKEYGVDLPTPDGGFHEFVVRKTKPKASAASQASPTVPARYMVVDANDSSVWVAFSYDTTTGVFTMYEPETDNGEQPYAYRRFIGGGRLEVRSVGSGVHTDVYTPDGSGEYSTGSERIYRYVTDGMRLFLQKIR